MGTTPQLEGKSFGRLTVLSRAPSKAGKAQWNCHCSCGGTTAVPSNALTSGHAASCGCLRNDRNRTSSLSHGQHSSPAYRSWLAMKTRCTNPNVKSYADYGAKGVKVCERWATSFASFLSDMGDRPPGTTLDRWPNTEGNYEPGNCRWATRIQQQRNTTGNVLLTAREETLTLAEWSEKTGISHATLSYRARAGWPADRVVSTAPILGGNKANRPYGKDGRFLPSKTAAKLGDEVEL